MSISSWGLWLALKSKNLPGQKKDEALGFGAYEDPVAWKDPDTCEA